MVASYGEQKVIYAKRLFSYVFYLPKYVENKNFYWLGLALQQDEVFKTEFALALVQFSKNFRFQQITKPNIL